MDNLYKNLGKGIALRPDVGYPGHNYAHLSVPPHSSPAALSSCSPTFAVAQERIVNGNMATFTGGVPDGWVQSDAPAATRLTSASSTTNSPFTNRYANNNSSWFLDDDVANGVDGYIQNGYAPHPRALVNFDFRLDSLVTGGTWGVQFNNNGSPAPNVSLVQFRIDTDFYPAPFDGTANTPQPSVLALTANTWYNVQSVLDVPAGTYSGTITPFGGTAKSFSGTIGTTGLNGLSISGTQVRDRSANIDNGNLTLDNVSVVPEPTSLALVGCAGAAFLARRRRKG